MTKKEEIYQNNVGHSVDLFKFGIQKAMEEYGKYCAEQAYESSLYEFSDFKSWWNEFKTKE